MSEPVFCQNCGRICKTVHLGDNRMPYCSRDCEIRGWVIDKYEGAIFLIGLMLIIAMALTADYKNAKSVARSAAALSC